MQQANSINHYKQQGIVLVIALLILMVMTVIGASMLGSATLKERLAGNLQQKQVTFQAADSCSNLVLQDSILVNQAALNIGTTVQNNCAAALQVANATSSLLATGTIRDCPGTDPSLARCYQIIVTSDAALGNGGAVSQTIQTVYREIPNL
ncbi:MAG TPA: hypothetical protein ENJ08_11290 [Gammaproteobacteria bacterium]|nr:hypothetical protein [Gammaproteobacteria bacterium]